MGTRSITRFFLDGKEIACVYQQFDGYPKGGVGEKLAKFLQSGEMVNGIPGNPQKRYFNGMGCLAAQYVAEHKGKAGNIYLYAPGTNDCGEEYTYEIHSNTVGTGWDSKPGPLTIKCMPSYSRKPFSGSLAEFAEWCAKDDDEEEAA